MSYLIRKATKDDILEITELGAKFAEYHREFDSFWSSADSMRKNFPDYIEKQLDNPTKLWLVTVGDVGIIGYFVGEIFETNPVISEEKLGYITHAFVDLKERQKGIGKAAVGQLYAWFKENSIKTVELSVSVYNGPGILFWEKCGFKNHLIRTKRKI